WGAWRDDPLCTGPARGRRLCRCRLCCPGSSVDPTRGAGQPARQNELVATGLISADRRPILTSVSLLWCEPIHGESSRGVDGRAEFGGGACGISPAAARRVPGPAVCPPNLRQLPLAPRHRAERGWLVRLGAVHRAELRPREVLGV